MIDKKGYWSEKIPYIKTLKEFYKKLNYKGINLWPVMAGDVYTDYFFSRINLKEELTPIKRAILSIRNFIFDEKLILSGEGNVLASFFMNREDHHEFFKMALKAFKKNELILLDAYENKRKSHIYRWKMNFPNLFLLFKVWAYFRRSKIKKVLGRYYIYYISKTYFRLNQINYFYKALEKKKLKAYVAFCSSAFPEESILTLLCNEKNIPTFTLQHGFYSINKKNFSSISVQNENVISNYYLVWGEKSKKSIEDWLENKSEAILAGNPKYSQNRSGMKKSNIKNIIAFLSVPAKEESNKKIVKILNKFANKNKQVDIKIKIHPFDKESSYSKLVNQGNVDFSDESKKVQDFLNEYDLVITHFTTIEIESLLYNVPILRFNDKESLPFWNYSDRFSNLSDFEKQFKKLENKTELKKRLNFYKTESKKNFYFEKSKNVPEVYHQKIIERTK